jgi:cytochrome oxidase assembly protein ShyY1
VTASRSRASLALPILFTSAALATFIGLGTWQLQRKAWKDGLTHALEVRLAAAPAELPPRSRWAGLTASADEFRRVKFDAAFVPGEDALVFAGGGSSFRPDVSGTGYWVFAPARLAGGGTVVVNRGFVPEGKHDPSDRGAGGTAPQEMIGVMRWPESPTWFTPTGERSRNVWFVRDPLAIAAAKGWPDVAPFFVELEAPVPPGGLPQPGPLKVRLRNDHLQYALTWYALALVLVVMFAFWLRSRRAAVAITSP